MPHTWTINQNQAIALDAAGCRFKPATLHQATRRGQEIIYAGWLWNQPLVASWTIKEIREFLSRSYETP